MYVNASFKLEDNPVFGKRTSLRLKCNHIKFRGTEGEGAPLPKRQPLPARNIQLDRLVAALDFLDVWNWKPKYDTSELGGKVYDGRSWSFSASIAGRECNTGGDNAYPSFEDAQKTSYKAERYAFLIMAVKSAFAIDEFANFDY